MEKCYKVIGRHKDTESLPKEAEILCKGLFIQFPYNYISIYASFGEPDLRGDSAYPGLCSIKQDFTFNNVTYCIQPFFCNGFLPFLTATGREMGYTPVHHRDA